MHWGTLADMRENSSEKTVCTSSSSDKRAGGSSCTVAFRLREFSVSLWPKPPRNKLQDVLKGRLASVRSAACERQVMGEPFEESSYAVFVLLERITYLQARVMHLLTFPCVLGGGESAERG